MLVKTAVEKEHVNRWFEIEMCCLTDDYLSQKKTYLKKYVKTVDLI